MSAPIFVSGSHPFCDQIQKALGLSNCSQIEILISAEDCVRVRATMYVTEDSAEEIAGIFRDGEYALFDLQQAEAATIDPESSPSPQ